MIRTTVAFVVLLALIVPALAGDNLGKKYKAALDYDPNAPGRDWAVGTGDVWELEKFQFALGGLKLETGPASVVFGHCGTSVV